LPGREINQDKGAIQLSKDKRPQNYRYFDILKDHLKGDLSLIFSGKVVYPRQIEIHLPGDHKRFCNFNCPYCQGNLLLRPTVPYEEDALELIKKLAGKIPYYIYGGAYSEPLLNPYFLRFLKLTKQIGSHFGIHTNGSLLLRLEKSESFLSEIFRIADSPLDYLSISLDAGTAKSHMTSKRIKYNWFDEIIEGLRTIADIKRRANGPEKLSLRVVYLLNEHNSSPEEILGIIKLMKEIGVDSLRFSIPYAVYGQDFDVCRKYKKDVEVVKDKEFEEFFGPLVSKDTSEKPYIFYFPPDYQDVDRMNYKYCVYCYYQITIGADGYVYRCSSTASPTFMMNQLGPVTSDLKEFEDMILLNENPDFRPSTCFRVGARCNRMALEINEAYNRMREKNG